MPASSPHRLDWVDAAKGLSIILVVMMHSAYGVGEDLNGTGVLHYIIGWATPLPHARVLPDLRACSCRR